MLVQKNCFGDNLYLK